MTTTRCSPTTAATQPSCKRRLTSWYVTSAAPPPASPLSLSHARDRGAQIEQATKNIDELTITIEAIASRLEEEHNVNAYAFLRDSMEDDEDPAAPEPWWKRAADGELEAKRPVKRRVDGSIVGGVGMRHFVAHPEPPKTDVETNVDILDDSPMLDAAGREIKAAKVDRGRRFCAKRDDDDDDRPIEVIDTGSICVAGARVPSDLAAVAKAHQREAIEFCLHNLENERGSILAHSMGLGKTFSALTTLDAIFRVKPCHALLLAPKSTRISWMDEFERWGDMLSIVMHIGKDGATLPVVTQTWMRLGGVLQMTYELFASLSDPAWLKAVNILVLDEAHVLSNPQTKTFKAVERIPTRARIALTGTPIANHLSEYHTILSVVAPDLLHEEDIEDIKLFERRFVRPIQAGQTKDATLQAAKLMRQHIHVLRMKMDSVMHRKTMAILSHSLPSKAEFVVRYTLSPQAQLDYDALSSAMCFETWQELVTRVSVNDKVRVTSTLLDECAAVGERSIVFSQRKDPLSRLHQQRGDGRLYSGELSDADRTALVHEFQSDQGPKVMYLTTQCGSLGLTLTAATRVVLMDCSWNPSYDVQAVFRAYRFGQTHPVAVYRLVAADTIEDYCYRLQIVKATLATNLIEEREINRQFTKADLKHDAKTLPIVRLPTGALVDPVLRKACASIPLVISSHDGAFQEDDDQLTDDEKREAQNEVNHTRNASERQHQFEGDGDDFFMIKPKEKFYKIAEADGKRVVLTVQTELEATGLYVPYVPYIASKTSTSVTLHLGPSDCQEVRMRRVVWDDDDQAAAEWSDPLVGSSRLRKLDDVQKVDYHAMRIDGLTDAGVYEFSARAVLKGKEASPWSDASAAVLLVDAPTH